MAAACSGGSTSASSGVAIMPTPANPPLPRPSAASPPEWRAVEQRIGDDGHDGRGRLAIRQRREDSFASRCCKRVGRFPAEPPGTRKMGQPSRRDRMMTNREHAMDARTAAITKSMRAGSATRWAFGTRPRARSTGTSTPKTVFDPRRLSTAAGSRGRANTCWNAVDRHVARARRAAGDGLRFSRSPARSASSPTTGCGPRCRSSPPSCATSASARATASSSTCRWCRRRCSPCWPARASARCIRWCSAASRARELATRIDDAKPKVDPLGELRHRARPHRARTSRCSTRRSRSPRTSPKPA